MQNAKLDKAQARIKIARRNINNLRYADDTTLMAESKDKLKSLLMKIKKESGNIKTQHSKTNIMASSPITSWKTDGETVETVRDFLYLSSKITADGDCSYEIKRQLFLRRKAMTNLDSILRSRDTYGYESWTIKKVEHRRIEAFELWCWRRLESPLDCKEIQPVHPKGIQSPGC